MSVTEVVLADGEDLDDVLAVAGALEVASQHPVAVAITRHAADRLGAVPAARKAVSLDGLGMRGSSTAGRCSSGGNS